MNNSVTALFDTSIPSTIVDKTPLRFRPRSQVPEARMLKYTEYNLDRKRDLSRAHSVQAQAKKAAAAKRKAEQLSQAEEGQASGQLPEATSPKSAKLEVTNFSELA